MFVDYYSLLEIDEKENLDEIKIAFRKQAIKWHPDRNPGKDTTTKMQLINEAYLILKDTEARDRFDKEYQRFKAYQQTKEREKKHTEEQKEQQERKEEPKKEEPKPQEPEPEFEYEEYSVKDDILGKWMANAKRQAVDLAKQTIKDFGSMVAVGVKEGAKAAGQTFLIQIGIGIVFLILFGLYKSCN